jgi:hypothetical protein
VRPRHCRPRRRHLPPAPSTFASDRRAPLAPSPRDEKRCLPNPSVHLARASDRGDVGKMFGWYRRAFIDTGSSAPLTHVMVRLASSSRPRAPRASRSFARSIFSRYP